MWHIYQLLSCNSVNSDIFWSRLLIMQHLEATVEEMCFLCSPCRGVISKGQSQFREFCTGGYGERT
jgi:hypothetical protein